MTKLIFINIFFTILLFCGLETTLYLTNLFDFDGSSQIKEFYSKEFYQNDPETLGYKPRPNTNVQVTKKTDKEIIYDVLYRFDEFSRRITPQEKNGSKKNFTVFLGGSNTFGEGLNENETLAFHFAKRTPQNQVYNYAFSGYGPNNVLALLESNRIKDEVSGQEGTFIFPYYRYLTERLIGTTRFFSWADGKHPLYQLDSNNEIKRNGTFESTQPILVWIKKIFGKSQVFKFLKIELPNPHTGSSFDLLCKSFKKIKHQIQDQKPKAKLIIFFGVTAFNKSTQKIMTDCLTKENITFINTKPYEKSAPQNLIIHPNDPHLNSEANQINAELISKLINESMTP